MAEQVNQRIEDMIGELEQMRRTELYDEEEIREIARKRKEFEYRVQRRVKEKDDYVGYIAYELALLEDISNRRKKAKLSEKRRDIEYAIAKRLNKVFKQFIYRFQNDVEVYFQYIKFCMSVGFTAAISGIIGQMLQVYGDKPSAWLMASKWESDEQDQPLNARNFLLKGIHRHPESDILYLELFKIEMVLAFQTEDEEEKEKQIKRADIIWRNAVKHVTDVTLLFKLFELSLQYDVQQIAKEIKNEIWERRSEMNIWPYIATKELEECHWEEIEEFVDVDDDYPNVIRYYMAVYEEALQKFPQEKLCTKYIHGLLGVSDVILSGAQKVAAVKTAWFYGHEQGLLSNDMYEFGINVLKIENETTEEQLLKILNAATQKNPTAKYLWQEKLLLSKPDEKKMLAVIQEAAKKLKDDDMLALWNLLLDCAESSATIKNIYKKFQNCESAVLMSIKPKLLNKMYEHCGLKAARDLYEEFIRTPPIQLEVHTTMINLESKQEKVNAKQVRKCYECLVQHCGADNITVWEDYMNFELNNGSAHLSPALYRRAIAALKKELVDEFIKAQTLAKIK